MSLHRGRGDAWHRNPEGCAAERRRHPALQQEVRAAFARGMSQCSMDTG
jgi:hypothetical protein